MSHNALPTASDVTTLLANLPKPIIVPSGFVTADQVNSAIAEWNDRTHYRPYFQPSSTPVPINYDPPGPDIWANIVGGSTLLLLRNGLISCTSIYNGVDPANGNAGNLLVQGLDYWLLESDAPSIGYPYTKVKFSYPQRGIPQSIIITGVWGFCLTTVPDDVWLAMLNLMCANVCNDFSEGLRNNYISIKDDDTTISRDAGLIKSLGMGFRLQAERTLFRKRLMTV